MRTQVRSLCIAQVGMSLEPTHDDAMRVASALCTLASHDVDIDDIKHDIINLQFGRDFLAEDLKYDIVIVHSVFHDNRIEREDHTFHELYIEQIKTFNEMCAISPKHKIQTWRDRLVKTEARWLFIFETNPSSLNGWQLSEIPDYKIVKRDHIVTVYRRS